MFQIGRYAWLRASHLRACCRLSDAMPAAGWPPAGLASSGRQPVEQAALVIITDAGRQRHGPLGGTGGNVELVPRSRPRSSPAWY